VKTDNKKAKKEDVAEKVGDNRQQKTVETKEMNIEKKIK